MSFTQRVPDHLSHFAIFLAAVSAGQHTIRALHRLLHTGGGTRHGRVRIENPHEVSPGVSTIQCLLVNQVVFFLQVDAVVRQTLQNTEGKVQITYDAQVKPRETQAAVGMTTQLLFRKLDAQPD